jgi:hypothetical protein
MSKRPTQLDKAISGLEDEITALDVQLAALKHVRDTFVAQRHQADLEVAHAPKLKTVAK